MLNKNEELDLFELLKNNFPDLGKRSLVIGVHEFLSENVDLNSFICAENTAKEAALKYIQAQTPYIVFDESEGYKCLFFRGQHVKIQYDASTSQVMRYAEETT